MPKLVRTKHASYFPQDELDDYNLIEEEEEEDDEEDHDSYDTDGDGLDQDEDEDDDHELRASAEDDEDEDHEEDEGIEEDETPRRKPTRAEERIRKLAKERKEAKEELETLKRQIASSGQNQQQQRPQQVDPAQEAAFRASLSPEELIRYDVNKILTTQKQQSDLQIFNMQDMMDRQAFQLRANTSSTHRRYGAEVERRLLDLRTNQRMNVSREVILANIVGEAVLSGKHKTVSRDKAKENMKKNKTRPSSGRSDTTREATRGGSEREKRRKRLESVTF